ncbi:MAG: hypothetical protein AAGE86_03915 [Pseudomonadota bacterium]
MNELKPGDVVIYRADIGYGVAKVVRLRDPYATSFLFDEVNRRWSQQHRKIHLSRVVDRLKVGTRSREAADTIKVLRNQRDAKRQALNSWFDERVAALGERAE